jgi:ABC-2 type transport system ATP-binding protein
LSTSTDHSPAIHIARLGKTYAVHERETGMLASVRGLIRRRTRQVAAVADLTLDIAPGEIVGFLGPNGAGKTTTLKMLAGLLYPTAGEATVAGYVPWRREKAFLRQITLVMGQRQQLVWDLPAADSFELNRAVYRIPNAEYRRTLAELVDLLELGQLLGKPVRNLSLGERMKCEVAAALLHRPRVLFLDEPTIGLDVPMQRRIRTFIAEYNRQHEATILLTSHYMADVEALCRRVVVIHQGRLLFDGDLPSLVQRFATHKTIVVELVGGATDMRPYGQAVARDDGRLALRVPKGETAIVTARLLADLPIADLTIEDPPIEDAIEHIFTQEAT